MRQRTDTRAGIPTRYRGVTFRSRLEARWAVFFDILKWPWIYEPFDANGYIPDFVLLGDDPVLVEVKPAVTLDELEQPVRKARDALIGHEHRDILGLGVTPFLDEHEHWYGSQILGALDEGDSAGHSDYGAALWNECGHCGLISFRHDYGWFKSRLCGHHDGDHYCNDLTQATLLTLGAAWMATADKTKWRS